MDNRGPKHLLRELGYFQRYGPMRYPVLKKGTPVPGTAQLPVFPLLATSSYGPTTLQLVSEKVRIT
eukprot:1484092-Rhodomonas_salina.2